MALLKVLFLTLICISRDLVARAITASAPSGVSQCTSTKFSWQGGTPPYNILFNTTALVPAYPPKFQEGLPSSSNQTIKIIEALGFGNIYDTSYSTLISFPLGQVTFQVTDATNTVSDPVSFSLGAGSTSACAAEFYPGPLEGNPAAEDSIGFGQQDLIVPCLQYFFLSINPYGHPPYQLAIRTVGAPVLTEVIYAGFTNPNPELTLPFPVGSNIEFLVRDSRGQTAHMGPFPVKENNLSDEPLACVLTNSTSGGVSSQIPSATVSLPFPTFATTISTSTYRSTSTSQPHGGGSSHLGSRVPGLSVGAIFGIVLGIPAGVFLVGGIVGYIGAEKARKRRAQMFQAL